MIEVYYTAAARKALRRMPAPVRQGFEAKITAYAQDPSGFYPWVKPLKGTPAFRIRQGDYRAVCELRGDVPVVLLILDAGPRGTIYKGR